jgi:hypothetical protein
MYVVEVVEVVEEGGRRRRIPGAGKKSNPEKNLRPSTKNSLSDPDA